ncbi:MAG TPA: MATE family efflux transporter [Methylocella sp.]|nr:MATE family efflux transporter [Methylocella sp.]
MASPPPNAPRVSHARVLHLALPMTLAHLSTPLLGIADAAIIGRLGEAHLLGAVAASAVIFDFIFWSFGFLRMGTAGLTAQAFGARDLAGERAAFLLALALAFGIGSVMILLRAPLAWVSFAFLDASPAVTSAARDYFDIRIWSAPFVLGNYAVFGAITGRGRTSVALALQLAIHLVNTGLGLALVYGFGLGIRGPAAGTLAAEVFGTAAGLCITWRLYGSFFRPGPEFILEHAKTARMFAVNRDIFMRNTALLFAFAFFYAQGARGGDIVLAGNAVLHNLVLLGSYFLDGLATAAGQLCGQALGAQDPKAFRASVRLTLLWSLAFASGLSAAMLLAGPAFIAFLTTEPQVRACAMANLWLAALAPLAGALAYEFDGVFSGATWTRDMRNLMLLSLALYVASFYLLRPSGNAGLWLSLLIFLLARGVSQLWRYRKLSALSFPLAQSSAATPVASESRG